MSWTHAGVDSQPTWLSWSYPVDISHLNLSTAPTLVADRAYDVTDPDNIGDVSGTILTNSSSLTTSIWTTPLIGNLTANRSYRIEVEFLASGATGGVTITINAESY